MDEPKINPISGDCECPGCPTAGNASSGTGTRRTSFVRPIFPVPATADTAPPKTGTYLRALDSMAEALEWIDMGKTPPADPLMCLLIHAALEHAEWCEE